MNIKLSDILHNTLRVVMLAAVITLWSAPTARAFSLSAYTQQSALAEGRWVKISVTETGMHLITAADLKNWGFSDPTKVRVYGYGGQRIPNALTRASYTDDLPMVQSVNTSKGIYFYAVGPVEWKRSSSNSKRYVQAANPFTTAGYYYLSDVEAAPRDITEAGSTDPGSEYAPVTTFNDRLYHEVDEFSPGFTGHYLVGEDFKYTPSRTFTFDLPDRDAATPTVWMETAFMAKTSGSPSTISFTANTNKLPAVATDQIAASGSDSYRHGQQSTTTREIKLTGDRLNLGINYSCPGTVQEARLDYVTINYARQLKLRDGKLHFWLSDSRMTIAGANAKTRVWDVTNPLEITSLPTAVAGTSVTCVNDFSGDRSYAAWNEDGTFPSPKLVGEVANQNIHGMEVPDMVIFSHADWISQAERLADYHRNSADSLKVLVVDHEKVYNEFSSGSPDVMAFRRMLKMMWDRGVAASPTGESRMKYALIMGRAFFDHRRLTAEGKNLGYPTLPIWATDDGLYDNSSWSSDDYVGLLADGSSGRSDRLTVAVGRMPVRSLDDARQAVDKLLHYNTAMPAGNWRNRMMLVADDEDSNNHMSQTEAFQNNILSTALGKNFFFDKIYTDAYEKIDNGYPEARNRMFRLLDEGVFWWNYVGHAGMNGWTHENLLTSKDINSLYYKRYPILYAATCDFVRWDEPTLCGAETMWHTDGGGVIAVIAATRPVYITDNGVLTANMGSQIFRRDLAGNIKRLGEIYREGKNATSFAPNGSSENRMKFVLMGDPAMVIAPSNLLRVTAINGIAADQAPTVMARQDVTIEGEVVDGKGNPLTDFSGKLYTTIYDAERSVVCRQNGSKPADKAFVFDEQGSRLYNGIDSIKGGKFKIKVVMPSEIADNYRPGAINLYARANDAREAIGCHRDVYIYGVDENATIDTIPPQIEMFVLNHESFRSGDAVNESPVMLARVSDNRGINLSQAGIGHQMSLTLDGTKTYTDLSELYTPNSDGSIGGSITYPLESLTPGAHTLELRVWDTSSNLASALIDFTVQEGLAPSIINVYTDANPASVEANFYVTHDRPDAMATVTISVYNLLGQEVWSSSTTGRSDMFQSAPVKWNLHNSGGHRVGRGIYLYRATISTDGKEETSATRRIAVTGG